MSLLSTTGAGLGHGRRPDWVAPFLGWCVHLYTALGLVAAAYIAICIVHGDPASLRHAFLAMLVACFIDATDGTLARRVRIREVVPHFDGRRLDDITDFLTYTFLPLLLLWRAEVFPGASASVLILPLLASAYGFCQESIKTDDGFFLGFPSLWNVVAFYLYALPLPAWAAAAVVVVLSVLTFIPSRYLYPTSRRTLLNSTFNLMSVAWSVVFVAVIFRLPSAGRVPDALTLQLTIASLFYPAFYLGASWVISVRLWGKARHA